MLLTVLISVFLLLISFILCKKIRPLFSVKVNCWFCAKDTVVPYGNKNCWDCPYCEQYNGFREDGDYNKPIPAQYDERLNFLAPEPVVREKGVSFNQHNGLCSSCNYNQMIKVRLLSEFIPYNEETYDTEAEAYQNHLEKVYGLCTNCDSHVKRKLTEQDSVLKPSVVRAYSVKSKKSFANYSFVRNDTHLWMYLSVTFSLLSCCFAFTLLLLLADQEFEELKKLDIGRQFIPLPSTSRLFGMLFAGVAAVLAGRRRFRSLDAAAFLFWILVQVTSTLSVDSWINKTQIFQLQASVLTLTVLLLLFGVYYRATAREPIFIRKKKPASPCAGTFHTNRTSLPSSQAVDESGYQNRCHERLYSVAPLEDKLGRIHISPQKPSCKSSDLKNCYSYDEDFPKSKVSGDGKMPLLRPARFSAPKSSVIQASWVTGRLWSYDSVQGVGKEVLWGVNSCGLLTPPPSSGGTPQESRSTTPKSSRISEGVKERQLDPAEAVKNSKQIPSWPPLLSKSVSNYKACVNYDSKTWNTNSDKGSSMPSSSTNGEESRMRGKWTWIKKLFSDHRAVTVSYLINVVIVSCLAYIGFQPISSRLF